MKKIILLPLMLFLHSCGGGGGSNQNPGTTSTPSPSISISSSSNSVLLDSTITITWSSNNATSCNATGAWSGSKSTGGNESIIVRTPGTNTYGLTCTGDGGSESASAIVEAYRLFSGAVVDGYIRGADVFIDENENFINDGSEEITTSDNNGMFQDLKYRNGNLISLNGYDLDTGKLLDGFLLSNKLSGHKDFLVITPITSIASFMGDPTKVESALGLDDEIDIYSDDPVEKLEEGGIYKKLYLAGNKLTVMALSLQNAMNSFNNTTDNSEDYFKAIAEELESDYDANPGMAVNIESSVFLDKVVDNIISLKASTIDSERSTNIKNALKFVIPLVLVRDNQQTMVSVQDFVLGTMQTDIRSMADGSATSAVLESYGSDARMLIYISNDQNISPDDLGWTNTLPVITSPDNFTVDENTIEIGTVSATDADGDTINWVWSGVDSINITVDSSSGLMSFTTAPDYENKSEYNFSLDADDGRDANEWTRQNVTIYINNINELGPEITSSASYSVDEGVTEIGSVTATDYDGDPITFSLSGVDAGKININSSGGLTFDISTDYESPEDENQDNTYEVTVTASDPIYSSSKDISIEVIDVVATYSISGEARTNNFTILDGDVPNRDWWDYVSNDTTASAQDIQSPSVIVGHLGTRTLDDVETVDELDVYQISLTAGLIAKLEVAAKTGEEEQDLENNNIDLYLYDADGEFVDSAVTSTDIKSLSLPSSGMYYIVPRITKGQSRYVLTIGKNASTSVNNSSKANYVKNELISYIAFSKPLPMEDVRRMRNKNKFLGKIKNDLLVEEIEPGLKRYDFNLDDYTESAELQLGFLNDNGDFKHSEEQAEDIRFRAHVSHIQNSFPDRRLELNYVMKKYEAFSEDPYFYVQWPLQQIKLPQALNGIGQETKNIVVGVIDSGSPNVDSTAWNASSFISGGYDFVSNASDAGDGDGFDSDPTDPDASSTDDQTFSHGTHVGSTIAAKNDGSDFNGFGLKVLPLRVCGTDASEAGCSSYAVNSALLYAAGFANDSGTSYSSSSSPLRVINMSLGFPSRPYFCDIIDDVRAQGIVVVAASGNDAEDVPGGKSYPASCDGVISVGATGPDESRAPYSDYNNFVDIAAPGGDLRYDSNGDGEKDGVFAWGKNNFFINSQGTSMAAPHVSGAIALMMHVNPDLSPADIDRMLQNLEMTNDIGPSGYDVEYGYGLLDVAKAIENAGAATQGVTFASLSPSLIDYGATDSSLDIELKKVGNGALSVTSLSADSVDGLSYTETNVNSDGFGTYTISLDRTDIPNGTYNLNLYFNLSNDTRVRASLSFRVGAERDRANIKTLFAALYDSNGDEDIVQVGSTLAIDMTEGTGAFSFSEVSEGNYVLYLSTEIDGDLYICQYGEICELYPAIGSSDTSFRLDKNITNIVVNVAARKKQSSLSSTGSRALKDGSIKINEE